MIERKDYTMHRSDAGSSNTPGFTLIELLVVIAIIALLIGILIPALSSARDSAKSLICSTRMRQVATGWQIYADTNRDISVPAQPGRYADESRNVYQLGNGLQYRPRWFAVIGAAAGFDAFANPSPERDDEHAVRVDGSEVFLCPVVPEWYNTRNYAYGYNHHFLGNTRFVNDDELSRFINFPVRASSLHAHPAPDVSPTPLVPPPASRAGDEPRTETTGPATRSAGRGWPRRYAIDPPRLTDNSDFARSSPQGLRACAPRERHLSKTNAAFCDGHIETLKLDDLGYVVRGDGAVTADDPRANKRQILSGNNADKDPPRLNR
ncbi:MAG: prepilin-type N-terminal cleavage/methylation domain-containing protein [Phycisphaerales bacterium]